MDTSVVFQRYFLVEQGTNVPEMKEEDQLIRVPMASVSCLSTTQVSYLSILGHANSISGVGYASDIKDSIIQEWVFSYPKQIKDFYTESERRVVKWGAFSPIHANRAF